MHIVHAARALIVNPEILLLDDALSAVDGKTEAEIIEGNRTEWAGKTMLITTLSLSAVQHADWIIVLDEGRIAGILERPLYLLQRASCPKNE